MVANIVPADTHPPHHPDPGLGSKGQYSTFSEYGHVAYQFKGNNKFSNMVANMLPATLHPDPGVGSKGQKLPFSDHGHVAYQIIGNHKCSNIIANIFSAHPTHLPTPNHGGEFRRSKFNFFRIWPCCISN